MGRLLRLRRRGALPLSETACTWTCQDVERGRTIAAGELHGYRVLLSVFCGLVLLLCGVSSCRRQPSVAPAEELEKLPFLQRTRHKDLQQELARLQAEQATPVLLEEATYGPLPDPGKPTRAEQTRKTFDPIQDAQTVRLLLQRLDRLYPQGPLKLDGVQLQKGLDLLDTCSQQLEAYRKALAREDFQVYVTLTGGLMADLSIVDSLRLAHRLEGLAAANLLATQTPVDALLPLRNMLRIDQLLAAVRHVVVRLSAAHLRAETLQVVAAMVEHPQCSRELQCQVLVQLETQLVEWPDDALAWIGDRALGLHAYEMVRAGQLLSILTEKELTELRLKGDLEAFAEAVRLSLNHDEWFYLRTMRRVIDSCSDPFYKRLPVLESIHQEAAALEDTPRFPMFAALILLGNLGDGLREQAMDRARCEAWVVALRAATGTPLATMWTNPVTGQPYELIRADEKIVVRGIDSGAVDSPISVPCLSP